MTSSPAAGGDPIRVAAEVVRAVAAAGDWAVPADLRAGAPAIPTPPAATGLHLGPGAGPVLLGERYEAALAPAARAAGAHYTPADLAAQLVSLVVPTSPRSAGDPLPRRIWDPACGGGAFLLAAADALVAAGVSPAEVVSERLWGTDVDPGAVAVAEAALVWWGHRHGVDARPGPHLAVGDTLLDGGVGGGEGGTDPAGPLAVAAASGFDVVVGNPPFQGQLAASSVRAAGERAALRARWGDEVVRAYTDTASLFLVAGARALAPGGRLLLIQPTSVLANRDAAASRAAAAAVAPLTGLWLDGEDVFGAEVQVCAITLQRPGGGGADPAPAAPVVRRWRGPTVTEVPTAASGSLASLATSSDDGPGAGWAPYALAALGVPDPAVRWSGRLGSIATARAGFRDEYYGLVGHVHEAPDLGHAHPVDHLGDLSPRWAPLVTSGLIDPGRCAWGERPASFARQRFERPVVDLPAVAGSGGRAASWVASIAVPKVVVATQTRVGEAAVDPDGRWVASTPTVAVLAAPERLWEVAAVICSPVGSLAALAATAGSARARDAIRHRVSSIGALPLPVDVDAWRAGADALRTRDRAGFLRAMAAAYCLAPSDEVDAWWLVRAPWPDAPVS